MSNEYQDKSTLATLYYDEGLEQKEIAEKFGVARNTISRWMSRHDISPGRGLRREHPKAEQPDPEYRKKEVLERLYYDEGLTQKAIAEKFGVSHHSISRWMNHHGINPGMESTQFKRSPWATFITQEDGYECIHAWSSELQTMEVFGLHRLLAVAEFGFDAVADKHVHHKKNIPWLNTPGNLELMSASEHISYHAQERERERDDWGRFV